MAEYISKYYDERRLEQVNKLHELQEKLPYYMQDYLSDLELSHAVRTSIAYTRELISFMDYLAELIPELNGCDIKHIPFDIIENLTYIDINDYQRHLSAANGDKAINRSMSALRAFFGFEEIHHKLSVNPTGGAARPRKTKKKPISKLEHDEVQDLLEGVEAGQAGTKRAGVFAKKTKYRDTAIVTLLLSTGIRVSECHALNIDDINYKKQSIRIQRKGGNVADIYFNDVVLAALKDYIELERPSYVESEKETALFLSLKKRRMAVRSIQEMVEKYGKSVLGIQNLHPHQFRATFGTNIYNSTGDIRLTADLLGHVDVNTTRDHYAAQNEERLSINKNLDLYSR